VRLRILRVLLIWDESDDRVEYVTETAPFENYHYGVGIVARMEAIVSTCHREMLRLRGCMSIPVVAPLSLSHRKTDSEELLIYLVCKTGEVSITITNLPQQIIVPQEYGREVRNIQLKNEY
jgi:hypothetical protein